jgi:hypothetical protein
MAAASADRRRRRPRSRAPPGLDQQRADETLAQAEAPVGTRDDEEPIMAGRPTANRSPQLARQAVVAVVVHGEQEGVPIREVVEERALLALASTTAATLTWARPRRVATAWPAASSRPRVASLSRGRGTPLPFSRARTQIAAGLSPDRALGPLVRTIHGRDWQSSLLCSVWARFPGESRARIPPVLEAAMRIRYVRISMGCLWRV